MKAYHSLPVGVGAFLLHNWLVTIVHHLKRVGQVENVGLEVNGYWGLGPLVVSL